MNIDDELKLALKRVEPPSGFAERLMLNIPATTLSRETERPSFWMRLILPFKMHSVRWAAAGVVVFLAAGGLMLRFSEQRREAIETEAAEAAKEQLLLALGVASEKMNVAQRKVAEIGSQPKESESRDETDQNRPAPRIRKRQTSQGNSAASDLFAALHVAAERIERIQARLNDQRSGDAIYIDN